MLDTVARARGRGNVRVLASGRVGEIRGRPFLVPEGVRGRAIATLDKRPSRPHARLGRWSDVW